MVQCQRFHLIFKSQNFVQPADYRLTFLPCARVFSVPVSNNDLSNNRHVETAILN